MTNEEAQIKDEKLAKENPFHDGLPPLAPCRCGGAPYVDTSMALIYCPVCELSFEYRYNRGVVPYYTWQLAAENKK
jgi:hypothetical protein